MVYERWRGAAPIPRVNELLVEMRESAQTILDELQSFAPPSAPRRVDDFDEDDEDDADDANDAEKEP